MVVAARFTEAEVNEAVQRYQSGQSLQEVATALGRSLYGVYYRLQKAGVEMRAAKPVNNRGGGRKGFKHSEASRRLMSEIAKNRGEQHNFFVDGKGRERDAARKREMNYVEYRLWREAVFSRDHHTCQVCGKVGGPLQADHITPWAHDPSRRYDVSNGRTLCAPCHRASDTYGSKAIRRTPATA